jgi:hypothetical protein
MKRETSGVPEAETAEQRTRRQLAALREISDPTPRQHQE